MTALVSGVVYLSGAKLRRHLSFVFSRALYQRQGRVEETVAAHERAVAPRLDCRGGVKRTGKRKQTIAMLEKVPDLKPGNALATHHVRELHE